MSAMARRTSHAFSLAVIFSSICLSILPFAQGQDVSQYLHDRYQGKIFVVRGFQANDLLRYDSSGSLLNTNTGDWTTDGFVRVIDIRLSGDQVIVKAQRMAVVWSDKNQFELRLFGDAKGKATRVDIKADPGMHNPSQEQVDAVLSKIFLTAQDNLADLVPDYWNPCVRGGLKGADKKCAFAPEMLAVLGVTGAAASGVNDDSATTASGCEDNCLEAPVPRRMGKGISPPRLIYHREPEFSEGARAAKYQGTVTLSLIVNKEGSPANVRISQPIGYGLDVKAVQAVQDWKFNPAEKDGQPVAVPIMVEVNFHLY